MIRFITYDIVMNKIIGIDNNVKSAIHNIKNLCNEKENMCITHDININFNEENNSINENGLLNRYYIIPIQKNDCIKVIFK